MGRRPLDIFASPVFALRRTEGTREVCRQVGKWYDHFQFWPCHLRTVADLKKDRSCLKKDNQAKSEALFIPGNAGGSRLDARSVTAVLKSLDGVSISNRPAEVNGVFVDEQPRP